MTDFLQIRGWDQFQHYKDRNPPWIKLHRDIFSSEDWVLLSDASKLLMVVCMVIGARKNGQVPNNTAYIKRVAYLDKEPDLTPLIKCGFLEFLQAQGSMMQAFDSTKQADARPEERREEKKDSCTILEVNGEKFEEFWKAMPKRGRHENPKKKAKEKFNNLLKDGIDPDDIIYGAKEFSDLVTEEGTEEKMVPMAITWLNQARWEQYKKPEADPYHEALGKWATGGEKGPRPRPEDFK